MTPAERFNIEADLPILNGRVIADAIANALARHEAKHHGIDVWQSLAAAVKERDTLRAIVDAARAVRSTGFQSRRADDGGRFLVGDDEYRALVNALEKEARDGTV